jgi:hypothetical protein
VGFFALIIGVFVEAFWCEKIEMENFGRKNLKYEIFKMLFFDAKISPLTDSEQGLGELDSRRSIGPGLPLDTLLDNCRQESVSFFVGSF